MTMLYTLGWPGMLDLPCVIVDHVTREVFNSENRLPLSKIHLNTTNNKYVELAAILKLFPSGKDKDAMHTFMTISSDFGLRKFFMDRHQRAYVSLDTLMVYIVVYPYCVPFIQAKAELSKFLQTFREIPCLRCGFIHRECICFGKALPDDYTEYDIVGFASEINSTGVQTDPMTPPQAQAPLPNLLVFQPELMPPPPFPPHYGMNLPSHPYNSGVPVHPNIIDHNRGVLGKEKQVNKVTPVNIVNPSRPKAIMVDASCQTRANFDFTNMSKKDKNNWETQSKEVVTGGDYPALKDMMDSSLGKTADGSTSLPGTPVPMSKPAVKISLWKLLDSDSSDDEEVSAVEKPSGEIPTATVVTSVPSKSLDFTNEPKESNSTEKLSNDEKELLHEAEKLAKGDGESNKSLVDDASESVQNADEKDSASDLGKARETEEQMDTSVSENNKKDFDDIPELSEWVDKFEALINDNNDADNGSGNRDKAGTENNIAFNEKLIDSALGSVSDSIMSKFEARMTGRATGETSTSLFEDKESNKDKVMTDDIESENDRALNNDNDKESADICEKITNNDVEKLTQNDSEKISHNDSLKESQMETSDNGNKVIERSDSKNDETVSSSKIDIDSKVMANEQTEMSEDKEDEPLVINEDASQDITKENDNEAISANKSTDNMEPAEQEKADEKQQEKSEDKDKPVLNYKKWCHRFEYTPTGEKLYRCTFTRCGQCFDTKAASLMHNKVHGSFGNEKVGVLQCFLCEFNTGPFKWFDMLRHLKNIHGEVTTKHQFGCFLCGHDFQSLEEVTRHMEFHCSGRYKCVHCASVLFTWKQVEDHIADTCELKDKKADHLGCPYCPLVFHIRNIRNAHMLSHSDKGLVCAFCENDELWDNWKLLRKHYQQKHGDKIRTSLNPLKKLSAKLQAEKELKQPALKDVKSNFKIDIKKNPICHVCEEEFIVVEDYEYHMRKKHDFVPYVLSVCEICEKTFKTNKMHEWHMRNTHSEEIKCDQCPFIAKSQLMLKIHIQNQHTSKEHSCTECGKEFDSYRELRMHMARHAMHSIYSCNICGTEFKRQKQLRAHMSEVHPKGSDMPEQTCPDCEYSCYTKRAMESHIKKNHPQLAEEIEEMENQPQSKLLSPKAKAPSDSGYYTYFASSSRPTESPGSPQSDTVSVGAAETPTSASKLPPIPKPPIPKPVTPLGGGDDVEEGRGRLVITLPKSIGKKISKSKKRRHSSISVDDYDEETLEKRRIKMEEKENRERLKILSRETCARTRSYEDFRAMQKMFNKKEERKEKQRRQKSHDYDDTPDYKRPRVSKYGRSITTKTLDDDFVATINFTKDNDSMRESNSPPPPTESVQFKLEKQRRADAIKQQRISMGLFGVAPPETWDDDDIKPDYPYIDHCYFTIELAQTIPNQPATSSRRPSDAMSVDSLQQSTNSTLGFMSELDDGSEHMHSIRISGGVVKKTRGKKDKVPFKSGIDLSDYHSRQGSGFLSLGPDNDVNSMNYDANSQDIQEEIIAPDLIQQVTEIAQKDPVLQDLINSMQQTANQAGNILSQSHMSDEMSNMSEGMSTHGSNQGLMNLDPYQATSYMSRNVTPPRSLNISSTSDMSMTNQNDIFSGSNMAVTPSKLSTNFMQSAGLTPTKLSVLDFIISKGGNSELEEIDLNDEEIKQFISEYQESCLDQQSSDQADSQDSTIGDRHTTGDIVGSNLLEGFMDNSQSHLVKADQNNRVFEQVGRGNVDSDESLQHSINDGFVTSQASENRVVPEAMPSEAGVSQAMVTSTDVNQQQQHEDGTEEQYVQQEQQQIVDSNVDTGVDDSSGISALIAASEIRDREQRLVSGDVSVEVDEQGAVEEVTCEEPTVENEQQIQIDNCDESVVVNQQYIVSNEQPLVSNDEQIVGIEQIVVSGDQNFESDESMVSNIQHSDTIDQPDDQKIVHKQMQYVNEVGEVISVQIAEPQHMSGFHVSEDNQQFDMEQVQQQEISTENEQQLEESGSSITYSVNSNEGLMASNNRQIVTKLLQEAPLVPGSQQIMHLVSGSATNTSGISVLSMSPQVNQHVKTISGQRLVIQQQPQQQQIVSQRNIVSQQSQMKRTVMRQVAPQQQQFRTVQPRQQPSILRTHRPRGAPVGIQRHSNPRAVGVHRVVRMNTPNIGSQNETRIIHLPASSTVVSSPMSAASPQIRGVMAQPNANPAGRGGRIVRVVHAGQGQTMSPNIVTMSPNIVSTGQRGRPRLSRGGSHVRNVNPVNNQSGVIRFSTNAQGQQTFIRFSNNSQQ